MPSMYLACPDINCYHAGKNQLCVLSQHHPMRGLRCVYCRGGALGLLLVPSAERLKSSPHSFNNHQGKYLKALARGGQGEQAWVAFLLVPPPQDTFLLNSTQISHLYLHKCTEETETGHPIEHTVHMFLFLLILRLNLVQLEESPFHHFYVVFSCQQHKYKSVS